MDVLEALKLECCEHNFKAEKKSKDQILYDLAKIMSRNHDLEKIGTDKIYAALQERENSGSTGFGDGIAIPHCTLEGLDGFMICLAIVKRGVNFDALDKKKVKIFVVIVGGNQDRNIYLQLLAQVSRMIKDHHFNEQIVKANSRVTLYEEFIRHSRPDSSHVKKHGKEKLMLLIVREEEIMQDITELFLEYGIQEATIIQTEQMENLLSLVPLFMGFFDFTGDKNPYTKIIMLKIPKNYINAIVKGLEEEFGDLDNFSGLSLIVLDIFFFKGF